MASVVDQSSYVALAVREKMRSDLTAKINEMIKPEITRLVDEVIGDLTADGRQLFERGLDTFEIIIRDARKP